MRVSLIIGVAFALALVLGSPARSHAAACGEHACGVPHCWNPNVRVRPDMTRTVSVSCSDLRGAKLVTPSPDSDISNIDAGPYAFRFDIRPHDDSPRFEEATFELTGEAGTVQQPIRIEVVPTAENSPPICTGDSVQVRSDGTGPVEVFMHPSCFDPDGDEFVMRGGGPGVPLDSPKSVAAGSTDPNWRYRTATFSGDESTTIWATDSLGARSRDAVLKVTVGPVDRPPECEPSAGETGAIWPIYSRPGAVRRFGVVCTDPDGDAFVPTLTDPPSRGLMAPLVVAPPSWGFWGVQQWLDMTYAPADDSLEPDYFSLGTVGAAGLTPAARMAIRPRPLPANSGGGCGWSPATVQANLPSAVTLVCEDEDGDPLSAPHGSETLHGTAGPSVITPAPYGESLITIPYVPNLGYEGYDCLTARVTDGNGMSFDVKIDITVSPDVPEVEVPPVIDPPDPPIGTPDPPVEVPDPPGEAPAPAESPTGPTGPEPPQGSSTSALPHASSQTATPAGTGSASPSAPLYAPAAQVAPPPLLPVLPGTPQASGRGSHGSVRTVVEQALGSKGVKRLRATGHAQVWSRSQVSRRDLLRFGRAPGVVVVCVKRCQIRGAARLAGSKPARDAGQQVALAGVSGQPQVLWLTITRAQRRALRHARNPRARFRVSIDGTRRHPRWLSRSISLSR